MNFITPVNTKEAPAAIGPYSQGILVNLGGGVQQLLVSGQIALDPTTGKLVGTNVTEQTEQVLKNVEAVLRAVGFSFGDVVSCAVFLKANESDDDFNDKFAAANAVYKERFGVPFPARAAVGVARLPKSKDVLIEIVCTAYKKTSPL